jgi:hypothetical protein
VNALEAIARQEEASEEVDALLTEYIGVLLSRYDAFLDDPPDDPNEELGSIRILVDDGVIAAYLNKYCRDNSTFLMCLPTIRDANEIEYRLAQWAVDVEMLREVITSFRPGDACEEYTDYLSQAVSEISDIFLRALVIPPTSFIGIHLNWAVRMAVVPEYRC